MIPAANEFVKYDHKPALFFVRAFYYHARALLDGLYVSHKEQNEENFPTFLLYQTEIQHTSSITN